jgi:hypothetical protein
MSVNKNFTITINPDGSRVENESVRAVTAPTFPAKIIKTMAIKKYLFDFADLTLKAAAAEMRGDWSLALMHTLTAFQVQMQIERLMACAVTPLLPDMKWREQ